MENGSVFLPAFLIFCIVGKYPTIRMVCAMTLVQKEFIVKNQNNAIAYDTRRQPLSKELNATFPFALTTITILTEAHMITSARP